MKKKMENKKDKMIFAIFGDGEFISWTYGIFMQLVDVPKVYSHSESQINTVVSNFRSKIRNLNTSSELGLAIIDSGQNSEKKTLSKYKEFDLRMYLIDIEREDPGYYSEDKLKKIISNIDVNDMNSFAALIRYHK